MNIRNESLQFLTKWWAYFAYIGIGLLGKFGLDIYNKKIMKFWYVISSAILACFVGYLTSIWCVAHKNTNAAIIVPISTLFWDKVISFLLIVIRKWLSDITNTKIE